MEKLAAQLDKRIGYLTATMNNGLKNISVEWSCCLIGERSLSATIRAQRRLLRLPRTSLRTFDLGGTVSVETATVIPPPISKRFRHIKSKTSKHQPVEPIRRVNEFGDRIFMPVSNWRNWSSYACRSTSVSSSWTSGHSSNCSTGLPRTRHRRWYPA